MQKEKKEHSIFTFGSHTREAIERDVSLCLWNVHKCLSKKLEGDVRHMLENFDICVLQEAVICQKWRHIWESAGEHEWGFFRAFSLRKNQGETGVLTGSRYRQEVHRILPTKDREPLLRTPKASGISLITIAGRDEKLMVVNTHAMNFNLGKPFVRQIRAVAEVIQHHKGPMIWAGDFNTWHKKRYHELAQTAGLLGLEWLIPTLDRRRLRLDHILYRGMRPKSAKVAHHIKSSDHYPVFAEFELI